MKTTKRILATLMTIIMLVGLLAVPAMAAGTITVTNAANGATYTLYKMFDLDYAADAYSYSIETSSPWYDFVKTGGAGASHVKLTAADANTYYVDATDTFTSAEAAAFAKLAETYVNTSGKTFDKTTVTASSNNAVFAPSEYGYYLIISPLGTAAILQTNDKNISIDEKTDLPTIEKNVSNAVDGTYGAITTATIGNTVYYQITITAESGAKPYEVTDTLPDGLTLDTNSITVTNKTQNTDADVDDHYTVDTSSGLKITFTQDFMDTLAIKDKIIIAYTATLNKNAIVGTTGNVNTAKLYATVGATDFKEATATVFTYKVGVTKTKEDGTTKLDGATFVMYRDNSGTKEYAKITDGVFSWTTTKGEATTFTTSEFTISGLGNGTYYLEETVVPTGYRPANDTKAVINGANLKLTIKNTTGVALPETGGMGTTLFYVAGGVLVLGAFVVLVKKRSGQK